MKPKRIYRLNVNLNLEELERWAGLAAEAGYRPKAQKLVKENKASGDVKVDVKGIAKFVRDCAVPDYEAHRWQREAQAAEALKKKQEAEDELRRLGRG